MLNSLNKTDDFIKMLNSHSKTDGFTKMIHVCSKTDDFIKNSKLSKTGLGRSGHDGSQSFSSIWHVSGPRIGF